MAGESRATVAAERSVEIAAADVRLAGDLTAPDGAGGVVVFAHGSGSGRNSPRNRAVSRALLEGGLATLLVDLLTAEEGAEDRDSGRWRFDVDLLGARVVAAIDWLAGDSQLGRLPVGCFGASTGAAAALIAAAQRPQRVAAVVSRGGRPDLAEQALGHVIAPTLLIVGGADTAVIDLNRSAANRIAAGPRVDVIPRAGHLFEEPGALEQVARLTRDFFTEHLPVAGAGP